MRTEARTEVDQAVKEARSAAESASWAADEAEAAAERAEEEAEKARRGGLDREPLLDLLYTVQDYLRGIRDRDELETAARRAADPWKVTV